MKKIVFAALAAIALASCQSNHYKIKGSGEGLAEGDTLFLTSDMAMGIPSDTIVVKDGEFELSGETDSTYLCAIYSKSGETSATFFVEPGTIKLEFAKDKSFKLTGTKVNEAFQELLDSTKVYNDKINKVAEAFSDSTITEEKQDAAMKQIEELQGQMSKLFLATAEKNIDNELGYFIVANYQDEQFGLDKKAELIAKLPKKMQEREAIKAIKEQAEAAGKTAVGKQIPEFTLNTPDDQPLNIMDEVKKNKVTILDFWASWCGPCRQEMPFMKELYAKFKDKGLGIVGISLDEDGDDWRAAIKDLGITWAQMSDLKGWQCEAGRLFQVNSIPFMVIVDEKGKILEKGLRGPKLEAFITDLLR